MADIIDPASRLEKLIAQQEPKFAAGFQLLVSRMKDTMDLEAISDLLQRGRMEEALTLVLRRAPTLGSLYMEPFLAAAKDTAEFLGRNIQTIVIDFDQTNPFAVAVARENRLRLVREFTLSQQKATREAIVEGLIRGAGPAEQARAFRDSIGLTQRQVRSVNNYRRLLEEGNSEALRLLSRDRRFDRTVRQAIANDRPLSPQQIDRMVDRFRERAISHRSRVIARTESLRAVHEGKEVMYQQAIANGDLDPNNMTDEWNTARDNRVRDSHESMHGQLVPFGELFISGKGSMTRHPGAFGVAAEDIQCRCAVGTRIVQVGAPLGLGVQILQ